LLEGANGKERVSPMRGTSFLIVTLALVMLGCSGPRTSVIDSRSAKADRRVMRVKIVERYNNARMEYTTEQRVGWVVDVDVLQGPPELMGKTMALPYDDFILGTPPPEIGTEVVMSPADWVTEPNTIKYRMRDR
jgi:hypothetical protein